MGTASSSVITSRVRNFGGLVREEGGRRMRGEGAAGKGREAACGSGLPRGGGSNGAAPKGSELSIDETSELLFESRISPNNPILIEKIEFTSKYWLRFRIIAF